MKKINLSLSALLLLFAFNYSLAQRAGVDKINLNPTTKPMKQLDYSTKLIVSQSPAQVFNAINNVRSWWSEQIEGNTDALGEVFDYHYQDVHRCKMKIVEFVPDQKVVWLVEENYFNFTKDKTEWKGTKIEFDIAKKGDKTELTFTHVGLIPSYECYNICSDAWGNYINGSLKNLIETGKGSPNPYQKAIDDATVQQNGNQKTEGDYTVSFLIDKAPATVFNAIGEVTKWWSEDFNGASKGKDDEFEVRFGDVHYSKHKVIEYTPFKKIVWLVTDGKLNFVKKASEWVGTKNVFEVSTENGKTRLTFTHVGLEPSIECFKDCSKGWDYYIKGSLLPYILTGIGNPYRAK